MSKALLALGLGGGIAVALAFRERQQIVRAAERVEEAGKRLAEAVVTKTGVISSAVLKNFADHGIGTILESHRGALPWALAAAVVELESKGDPGAYNYYPGDDFKATIKRDVWRPGQPLPDGKDGRPHAWAAGLMQIIRKFDRKLTLEERFDPAKSAAVILPELAGFYRASAMLSGPAVWAATYFGHNQGVGSLTEGLKNASAGIAAVIKSGVEAFAAGRKESPENTAKRAAAAALVALRVAARVPLWMAVESSLRRAT